MKVKTENKKKMTLVAPPLNHAVCLDRNRIKDFALIQVVLLTNLYFTGMRQNIIYSMLVLACRDLYMTLPLSHSLLLLDC